MPTDQSRLGRGDAESLDLPEPIDVALVARARAGDHEAFRRLVERYQARALGLARRILRDGDLARDALQEAFLKAYTHLDRFEGRSSFYTWLYRLVVNQCLDRRRRERSQRLAGWADREGFEPMPAAGAPTISGVLLHPATALHRSELRHALDQAVAKLGDGARRTLLLREVDGLSYAEIAGVLGVPVGTVMSRLHYARRRVRRLLEENAAPEVLEG